MDGFDGPTPYTFDIIDPYWLRNPSTCKVSVGIYRMVPTRNGWGRKQESAKIRVVGYPHCPEDIYQAAQGICDSLNNGAADAPAISNIENNTVVRQCGQRAA